MKSKIVKLYGVERSETNWIQSLLELNTDALDNELIELINMTVSERVFNGLKYKKLWK